MRNLAAALCFLLVTGLGAPALLIADDPPATEGEGTQPPEEAAASEESEEVEVAEVEEEDDEGTEISGYVSTNYCYNFNDPATGENTGRGFDVRHNEFMFDKLVLRLEKSVEYSATDWAAGYKGTLIFGQDAEFTQAAGLSLGDHGDLFEGNVTVNLPVGRGLLLTLGKYGTTIGYESSFMEETYNWSGGNQWTFIEPFTHTGVMLSYAFTDQWEVNVLINNGWDIVRDNNTGKSFMGTLTFTPNDETYIAFTAYGGPEQDEDTSNWKGGIDFYVDRWLTEQVDVVVEVDYGGEEGAASDGTTAKYWAIGGWLIYEPGDKWSVAVRADYLDDRDGAFTGDGETPYLAPFPENDGQKLYSLTTTLNLMPVDGLRIAPEFRWDHSSLDDAFDESNDQVTLGFLAAYFF